MIFLKIHYTFNMIVINNLQTNLILIVHLNDSKLKMMEMRYLSTMSELKLLYFQVITFIQTKRTHSE